MSHSIQSLVSIKYVQITLADVMRSLFNKIFHSNTPIENWLLEQAGETLFLESQESKSENY
jgi:hypothetical protein